jgi:hypothetical protein
MSNVKNIIIIGGGWYGCHIASILKDKFNITIIEKEKDIFNNSSYYNQNRLHLGYHYCRNFPTRKLCQENYDRFIKNYKFGIEYISNNYYVISKESIMDYQTYVNIYTHEKFDFDLIDNTFLNNIDGKLIQVKENVINSDKIYNFFKEDLKNVNFIFNTKIISYFKENDKIVIKTSNNLEFECDLLLDCTYNQFGLSKKNYIYEKTISLLFKKINPCDFNAITIMDGIFSSLYPRDVNNNIYTLTDVEHTPLIKSSNYEHIDKYVLDENKLHEVKDKIINKFVKYYPDFLKYFSYTGYFLSKKTKQISMTDTRDIIIEEIEKNIISVNCGKIYGIFEWEDYILKYLNL